MLAKLKNIFYLFKCSFKIDKRILIIIIIKNLFKAAVAFINILGIGFIIDALETNLEKTYIVKLICIYVGVNLLVAVIREIIQLFESNIDRKVSNKMQFEYSNDAININYHFVQDNTILNLRRKSMSGHPAGSFMNYIGDFCYYLFQFVGIISIFLVLSPVFVLIILITSLISIFLIFVDKNNNYNFNNDKTEEDRKTDYLYSVMTDYKYAKEIRINNAKSYIGAKYNNIFTQQLHKIKKLFRQSLKISLVSTLISVLQTIVMYFYFTYCVFSKNITIAEYSVLLSSTTLLMSLLIGIFNTIAILNNIAKSANFYKEYKQMVQLNSTISQSNTLEKVDIDMSDYLIKFENVSFSYPENEAFSLKNINLEIKKHDKIGIVGLNGSGKTTFIKLLTRLYDPTEGIITLNGQDIKTIPYKQYIEKIAIVLQDFSMFAYSIKENVVFDKDYDETKLHEAISQSGLDEKIKFLDNGLETSLYKIFDSQGIEFSKGEAQKLALARAIYKNGSLLVLDEPTSAMDPIAEFDFFSNVLKWSEDLTVIFISHRLSSTRNCNKILVFNDGKIVERGNHQQLMAQEGLYYELFTTQAQYYQTNKDGDDL